MQKKLFVLLLPFFVQFLYAQENFEGKITYTISSTTDTAFRKQMTAFLKGNKIFVDNKISNKESITTFSLYDFEIGRAYSFIYDDSVALYSNMTVNIFPWFNSKADSADAGLQIQEYSCKKKTSVIYAPMNQYFKKVENWFTDKIYFKTNSKANFASPPFPFFNESSISLKTIISFTNEAPGASDIIVEATEIKEEKIDEAVFQIPAFMKEMSVMEYSKAIMEKFKATDAQLGEINNKLNKMQEEAPKPAKSNPGVKRKQTGKTAPSKAKQ